MRQKLLLFLLIILGVGSNINAQRDTMWYRTLVISEIRETNNKGTNNGYIELTNMGDSTLNLADYWIQNQWNRLDELPFDGSLYKWSFLDSTTLAPGESYVFASRSLNSNNNIYGVPQYPNGYYNVYLEKIADYYASADVIVAGSRVTGLYYRGDTSSVDTVVARDSSLIDKFWYNTDEYDPKNYPDYPIAGVITPIPFRDFSYARKFSVKHGNPDFAAGAGTNEADSEWIVFPHNDFGEMYTRPYTSVGSHSGETALDLSSPNAGISIDVANKLITVPYGISRDSIFWEFELGPNHAWNFRLGPDTAQYYVSTGDSIDFYVMGTEGATYEFGFQTSEKPNDFSQVRPLNYKNAAGNWTSQYTVSQGHLPEDTIGGISYSLSVDTLLKYLVIEEGSAYEFLWVDDTPRPELKDGDKLKITSGGNSKTYRLSVYNYIPNHSAEIRAVYFPGFYNWENDYTFEATDTFIDFQPTVREYVITLPEGTEQMPAMVASASNNRAKVYIKRPSSLLGTDVERTAVITVTAEDDTTITTYKFLFNVERELPEVVGTPFISDIANGWGNRGKTAAGAYNIQVFNPASEELDLINYFMIKVDRGSVIGEDWPKLFEAVDPDGISQRHKNNSNLVSLGGLILDDGSAEGAFLESDLYYRGSVTLGSNDTYTMAGCFAWPNEYNDYESDEEKALFDGLDRVIGRKTPSSLDTQYGNALWGEGFADLIYEGTNAWWPFFNADNSKGADSKDGAAFALIKTNNDSILDGTKAFNAAAFDVDFDVVDVVNGMNSGASWIIYDKLNGEDTIYRAADIPIIAMARKPYVYKGNPVDLASFGSEGHEGEWNVYGSLPNGKTLKIGADGQEGLHDWGRLRFNNHIMTTYAHIPFITSNVYLIGKGLTGVQDIYGVTKGTDVTGFMDNIILPDTAMSVVVKDNSGTVKEGSDQIVDGDMVLSTAANGSSSVEYKINVGALNNDVSLTPVDGSGLTVEGTTVSNVIFGSTLLDLISKLEVNEFSSLTVTDGADLIIPMEKYSRDTLLIQSQTKTEVLVDDKYKIEVKAQDGSLALYSIVFAAQEELMVYSDHYKVIDEFKTIDHVDRVSVSVFLGHLKATPGADIYVINKMNQLRADGIIQYGDRLVVEKGDMQVIYLMKFNDDNTWGVEVEKVASFASGMVYPNPTQGAISVNGLSGATDIHVHNIAGQLVNAYKVNADVMQINISGPTGVYFVSILKNERKAETIKVVKN